MIDSIVSIILIITLTSTYSWDDVQDQIKHAEILALKHTDILIYLSILKNRQGHINFEMIL